MLKLRHPTMLMISGCTWLAIGTMLLSLGLKLLVNGAYFEEESLPMLNAVAPFVNDLEQAALVLVALGLFMGYFKGRFVLSKTAFRTISHIRSLPEPAGLGQIYSKKYYILLAAMMGLSMAIKYFGVPNDVRGAIDVAVGSALLQGSVVYFREARAKVRPA